MSEPAKHPYARAPRLPGEAQEPMDPRALFPGVARPIELELGPGRGGFLFERLEAAPDARLLGLEIRLKWATLVDEKLAAMGHAERARVFAADARQALARFPAACVSVAYAHFPDPWWKKRHEKRLLLQSDVASHVGRVLIPGGELFVQTDVEERALAYERTFGAESTLEAHGDAGGPSLRDNPYGARSPREHRAIVDGLPVYRLRYRRRVARP